jgi:hypothetical protein
MNRSVRHPLQRIDLESRQLVSPSRGRYAKVGAIRVSGATGAFRWDIAREGQRLLRTTGVAERVEWSFPINVILNWTALLEN